MNRRLCCLLAGTFLVACSGVPLRSLPRVMQLSGDMLEADPAEFRLALQVDARFEVPRSSSPQLHIQLTPKEPGTFERIDKKLPMQLHTSTGVVPGLDGAPPGRRWWIYSLPPATQSELRRVREIIRAAKDSPSQPGKAGKAGKPPGGSLSIGIQQTSVAMLMHEPKLSNTAWHTWLQVKQADGYLEIWRGTPSDLMRLAAKTP